MVVFQNCLEYLKKFVTPKARIGLSLDVDSKVFGKPVWYLKD